MSVDMLKFNDSKFHTSNREHFKLVFKLILVALDFLRTEANVIHTDIKLDSVMLRFDDHLRLPALENSLLSNESWDIKEVVDDELTIYTGMNMLPTKNHGPAMLCDYGQTRIGPVANWNGYVQP